MKKIEFFFSIYVMVNDWSRRTMIRSGGRMLIEVAALPWSGKMYILLACLHPGNDRFYIFVTMNWISWSFSIAGATSRRTMFSTVGVNALFLWL